MTNEEYVAFLEEQGEDYVWQFTKQETDFSKIFLSAKLFNEWKQTSQSQSSESFFKTQHEKYGITDRHRTLIISQLYGLLTKRSTRYENEELTPAFIELNSCDKPLRYKELETEQLLKVKLPAITYSRQTESKTTQRHIFPIIFIYQILKRLKQIGMYEITLEELYTYVMTANFHSDLDRVFTALTQPSRPTISDKLFRLYKDRSRVIPLIKNLDLFKLDDKNISINSIHESEMDDFLEKNFPRFSKAELTNFEIYKKFLYTIQNFNLNLISDDAEIIIADNSDDIRDDAEYTENVVSQENISESSNKTLGNSSKEEPQLVVDKERLTIKRDAMIGVLAINNSGFKCEFDSSHETFISKRSKKPYMEAHHLIPVSQSQYIWNKKHANVDCIENIVSLCPTCHRAIHHGELDVKLDILKKLYDQKKDKLAKVGLDIDFETLLKFYL